MKRQVAAVGNAERIIFDVICIIAVIIMPMWLLRLIGIERMVLKGEG